MELTDFATETLDDGTLHETSTFACGCVDDTYETPARHVLRGPGMRYCPTHDRPRPQPEAWQVEQWAREGRARSAQTPPTESEPAVPPTVPVLHLTDEQVAALDDAAHVAAAESGLDVELTLAAPSALTVGGCVGFELSASLTDVPFLPVFVREIRRSALLEGSAAAALLEGSATVEIIPSFDASDPTPCYRLSWPGITGGSPADDR